MNFGISIENVSLSDGETYNISVNLTTTGAKYVSAFMWNCFPDMIPVSEKMSKDL